MFTRELYFIEQYVNDFRGEKYEIYKFIDPYNLKVIYGTNITTEQLEPKKAYNCLLDYKRSNNQDKVIVSKIEKK